MTTIKGFIRSYAAAARRAERSRQRNAREAAKRYKQQAKEQELLDNEQAVADYENYIEALIHVHRDVSDTIDWQAIAAEPEPPKPTLAGKREAEAHNALNGFKPSFLDKTLGLTKKKVQKLEQAVTIAKALDKQEFDGQLKEYDEKKKEWRLMTEMARGIIARNPLDYKNAIEYFKPFSEIKELGATIGFSLQPDFVNVDLLVNDDSIIPNYVLSKTSTGKLSRKNITATRFNELYQDFVCSCVLRIIREVYAYLPVKMVLIHAIVEMVNSSNGRMEKQCVLSLVAYPDILQRINFDAIDPSDAMRNFLHNMKFSKTTGFSAVAKIDRNDISN